MLDETNLRAFLLALTEDAKSQYLVFSALNTEIEALRETVRVLDPTFADTMAHNVKQIEAKHTPIVQAVVAGYDAKLQILKDGLVC
jgi:hypothetical protein